MSRSHPEVVRSHLRAFIGSLPAECSNDVFAALGADEGHRAAENLELALRGGLPTDWIDTLTDEPPTTRHERAIWNLLRVLCGQTPELWASTNYPAADPASEQLTVALEVLVIALITPEPEGLSTDAVDGIGSSVSTVYTYDFTSSEDRDDDDSYEADDGDDDYYEPDNWDDDYDNEPGDGHGRRTFISLENASPREIARFERRSGICIRHEGLPQHRSECPCNDMTRRARLARWVRERIPGTSDRDSRLRQVEVLDFSDSQSTHTHVSSPPPPYEVGSWVDIALPPCYTSVEDVSAISSGPTTADTAIVAQSGATLTNHNTALGMPQRLKRTEVLTRMARCIGRLIRDDFRHACANEDDFKEMSVLVRQLCRRRNFQQGAIGQAAASSEQPQARPSHRRASSVRQALQRAQIRGRLPSSRGNSSQETRVPLSDPSSAPESDAVPRRDVDATSRNMFALVTIALARVQTSWRNGQ